MGVEFCALYGVQVTLGGPMSASHPQLAIDTMDYSFPTELAFAWGQHFASVQVLYWASDRFAPRKTQDPKITKQNPKIPKLRCRSKWSVKFRSHGSQSLSWCRFGDFSSLFEPIWGSFEGRFFKKNQKWPKSGKIHYSSILTRKINHLKILGNKSVNSIS